MLNLTGGVEAGQVEAKMHSTSQLNCSSQSAKTRMKQKQKDGSYCPNPSRRKRVAESCKSPKVKLRTWTWEQTTGRVCLLAWIMTMKKRNKTTILQLPPCFPTWRRSM